MKEVCSQYFVCLFVCLTSIRERVDKKTAIGGRTCMEQADTSTKFPFNQRMWSRMEYKSKILSIFYIKLSFGGWMGSLDLQVCDA